MRAPLAAVRRVLSSGASPGITIVAGIPRRLAASETAIAWLPEEKATTPRRRWSGESCDKVLKAPRNLNAPPCCRFSHLKKTWAARRASSAALLSTGVRTAWPSSRSAAAATSSKSIASPILASCASVCCLMLSFHWILVCEGRGASPVPPRRVDRANRPPSNFRAPMNPAPAPVVPCPPQPTQRAGEHHASKCPSHAGAAAYLPGGAAGLGDRRRDRCPRSAASVHHHHPFADRWPARRHRD